MGGLPLASRSAGLNGSSRFVSLVIGFDVLVALISWVGLFESLCGCRWRGVEL